MFHNITSEIIPLLNFQKLFPLCSCQSDLIYLLVHGLVHHIQNRFIAVLSKAQLWRGLTQKPTEVAWTFSWAIQMKKQLMTSCSSKPKHDIWVCNKIKPQLTHWRLSPTTAHMTSWHHDVLPDQDWPKPAKTDQNRHPKRSWQFRTVPDPGLKSCWCGAFARHREVQRCPFDQQSNKKTNKNNSGNSDNSAGARHGSGTAKAIATSEAEPLGAKKKRRVAQNLLVAPNVFCTVLAFLPRSWRNAERALELPASVSIKIPSGEGGYSPLQRRAFTQNSHFIRRAVSCRRKIAVPVHAAGRIGPIQEHSFSWLAIPGSVWPKSRYLYRASKAASSIHKTPGCLHGFTRFYPMTWTAFCATACSSSWIDGVGTVSRGIELSKFLNHLTHLPWGLGPPVRTTRQSLKITNHICWKKLNNPTWSNPSNHDHRMGMNMSWMCETYQPDITWHNLTRNMEPWQRHLASGHEVARQGPNCPNSRLLQATDVKLHTQRSQTTVAPSIWLRVILLVIVLANQNMLCTSLQHLEICTNMQSMFKDVQGI